MGRGVRRLLALLLPAVLVLALGSCRGGHDEAAPGRAGDDPLADLPVHAGPVVVILLDSLRADVVDDRLTPHLHRLAAEADWAGRAVAPSSWALPSLASLVTGLSPWSHGVVGAPFAELDRDLVTLAEALEARGYVSTAYVSGPWFRGDRGWGQGLGELRGLRGAGRAEGHLASLGPEEPRRQMVWIQIPEPAAPYVRRDDLLGRLPDAGDGPGPADLPPRLEAAQLARWADPATPVPPAQRRTLSALYRLNAAHADRRLGRLLDSLRESGAWDDTLLVVTSPSGEDLGEHGGTGSGTGLGRALLEVPLVIKLPRSLRRADGSTLPVPPGRRVALTRVWPTLVAAVGGATPPAVGPSLFEPVAPPVLSELYLENGFNEHSLVAQADGETWQLLWRSPFAPAEPAFHLALEADLGGPAAGLAEPPLAIFERLTAAFRRTPPLSGGGAVERTLVRWEGDEAGGVEAVVAPEREAAMAAELRRRWLAFHGCERSLDEERTRKQEERPSHPDR